MKVRLCFTGGPTSPFEEEVEGHLLSNGWVELDAHSTFVPLGPGDAVEIDLERRVTGVCALYATHTMQATLHLPRDTTFAHSPSPEHPAMRAVAETREDWERSARVTQDTAFSFVVSHRDKGWLEDNVEGHPYVEHAELVRTPAMRIDRAQFEHLLAHPAFS